MIWIKYCYIWLAINHLHISFSLEINALMFLFILIQIEDKEYKSEYESVKMPPVTTSNTPPEDQHCRTISEHNNRKRLSFPRGPANVVSTWCCRWAQFQKRLLFTICIDGKYENCFYFLAHSCARTCASKEWVSWGAKCRQKLWSRQKSVDGNCGP